MLPSLPTNKIIHLTRLDPKSNRDFSLSLPKNTRLATLFFSEQLHLQLHGAV